MKYVIKGDGEKDRELTKEEYRYLLEKLVDFRISKHYKTLIQ